MYFDVCIIIGDLLRPYLAKTFEKEKPCLKFHLSKVHLSMNRLTPLYGRKMYKNGQNHVTIQMLVDAREMLVNARKLQKRQEWVQGFQTHQL